MKNLQRNKYNIISIVSKYIFLFIIMFVLTISVLAQTCESTNPNKPTGCTPANTGIKIDTHINNPIAGIDSLPAFIEAILNFVLIVGVPIVALAIIYSGFLFLSAQGNSEKLTKAKKALMYTLIGAALLLGSYVIASSIKGTVDEIRSTT